METTQQNVPATLGAPSPEIPLPPGGGSWTFDESSWQWVSNDPAPVQDAAADADAAVDTTEQEQ